MVSFLGFLVDREYVGLSGKFSSLMYKDIIFLGSERDYFGVDLDMRLNLGGNLGLGGVAGVAFDREGVHVSVGAHRRGVGLIFI
jgi:hypothetical protein